MCLNYFNEFLDLDNFVSEHINCGDLVSCLFERNYFFTAGFDGFDDLFSERNRDYFLDEGLDNVVDVDELGYYFLEGMDFGNFDDSFDDSFYFDDSRNLDYSFNDLLHNLLDLNYLIYHFSYWNKLLNHLWYFLIIVLHNEIVNWNSIDDILWNNSLNNLLYHLNLHSLRINFHYLLNQLRDLNYLFVILLNDNNFLHNSFNFNRYLYWNSNCLLDLKYLFHLKDISNNPFYFHWFRNLIGNYDYFLNIVVNLNYFFHNSFKRNNFLNYSFNNFLHFNVNVFDHFHFDYYLLENWDLNLFLDLNDLLDFDYSFDNMLDNLRNLYYFLNNSWNNDNFFNYSLHFYDLWNLNHLFDQLLNMYFYLLDSLHNLGNRDDLLNN